MTRNEFPVRFRVRRPFGGAAALGAILALGLVLGGCESLGEAFSGVNPVSKKLDESAAERSGARSAKLAIPPGYGQRPGAAAKAADGERRDRVDAPEAGADKAPEKAGDSKKIDLRTGSAGETVESRILDTNPAILREDRVETRGRENVEEGEPSKGEKELLKKPAKK